MAAEKEEETGADLPVLRARIEPHDRVDGVPGTEYIRRGTLTAIGAAYAVWSWRPAAAARHAVQRPVEDVMVSVVNAVVNSELADRVIDNVLESDEIERIVGYIANSEEVRDAIAQQSAGVVSYYTGEAAGLAQEADGTVETLVRKLLRRTQRDIAAEPRPPDRGKARPKLHDRLKPEE